MHTTPISAPELMVPGSTHPAITLSAAEVRGPRGRVFGPITARSAGPITVVLGGRGSGRTSLLLALGGRMRLTGGELSLLGHTSPGDLPALRKTVGLVGFAGIDELEPSVTVAATIRERLAWASPWYRRAPRVTAAHLDRVLMPCFGAEPGSVPIPDPHLLVRDLTQAQDRLLRIGLARIEQPRLLLVDDFDDIRDPADRHAVAARLRSLAATGTHSIVATADHRDLPLFGLEAAQIRLGD